MRQRYNKTVHVSVVARLNHVTRQSIPPSTHEAFAVHAQALPSPQPRRLKFCPSSPLPVIGPSPICRQPAQSHLNSGHPRPPSSLAYCRPPIFCYSFAFFCTRLPFGTFSCIEALSARHSRQHGKDNRADTLDPRRQVRHRLRPSGFHYKAVGDAVEVCREHTTLQTPQRGNQTTNTSRSFQCQRSLYP